MSHIRMVDQQYIPLSLVFVYFPRGAIIGCFSAAHCAILAALGQASWSLTEEQAVIGAFMHDALQHLP